MLNKEIRNEAKNKGVFLYEIAEKLNKSEATMTRLMRHELSADAKHQIKNAIVEIASSRAEN